MTKFADQWEPNGPFGIVTDSNMSGGYRVVTNDVDKTDITILPPERQKVGMLVYVSATGKTWRLTTLGVRSPGTESYSSAPVFVEAGTVIGGGVSGSTPNSVLYADASGNLAQDPNFTYTAATSVLDVNGLRLDGAAGLIDRATYGPLLIGSTDNVGPILIGTGNNDDSVTIGRVGGPPTTIPSEIYNVGVDARITTAKIDPPVGITSTLTIATVSGASVDIATGAGSGSVTIGRTGGTLYAPSKINANGGIGISAGTSLDIGNDIQITGGIFIGTAAATGNVSIGSPTNPVIVSGVLNANGGIGLSSGNTLNIGNDATITAGINIGTTGTSAPITIGGSSSTINIGGTVVIGATVRPDINGGANVGLSGTRFDTVFANSGNFSALFPLTLNGVTIGSGSGVITVPARIYSAPSTNDVDATLTLEQDYSGAAGAQDPTVSPGAVGTDVGVLASFESSAGLSGTSIVNTEDYPVQVATTWGPLLQCGAIKVRLKVNGTVTRGFIRVWFTPTGG